jgi:hypothetical protein
MFRNKSQNFSSFSNDIYLGIRNPALPLFQMLFLKKKNTEGNFIQRNANHITTFKKHFFALGISLIVLCQYAIAQQKNIPLVRPFTQEIERFVIADTNTLFHQAAKPYVESEIDINKIYLLAKDTIKIYYPGVGKIYKHHLLSIRTDDFFLAADPLFDLSYGEDFADTTSYAGRSLFTNQRGLQFIGDIGKQFSFQTSFYETQNFVPLYLKHFVDSMGTFPGFGRVKPYNLNGYDFAMANGWISYSPKNWLNLQFGQGKQFYGHGYRSILLSDAAFSYPYIRARATSPDKRWQYTATYASLQTLERLPLLEVPEALFKRKGGSFHYLSWLPHRKIELGLFEGIIWERYDSTGTIAQPWGAYIPVIGANTLIQGFEGVNHVMVGLNARVQIVKRQSVYVQLATDHPGENRFGYQIGYKHFDLLVKNLDLQIEWNNIGSSMYANHAPLQTYSHVNQPLGHPTGPATDEIIAILNYRYKRLFTQVKYNNIVHSVGPDGSWQSDPNISYTNIADWPQKNISHLDIQLGVNFNPVTNFQIMAGFIMRSEQTEYNWSADQNLDTRYAYLSLRTNLINRYTDF